MVFCLPVHCQQWQYEFHRRRSMCKKMCNFPRQTIKKGYARLAARINYSRPSGSLQLLSRVSWTGNNKQQLAYCLLTASHPFFFSPIPNSIEYRSRLYPRSEKSFCFAFCSRFAAEDQNFNKRPSFQGSRFVESITLHRQILSSDLIFFPSP